MKRHSGERKKLTAIVILCSLIFGIVILIGNFWYSVWAQQRNQAAAFQAVSQKIRENDACILSEGYNELYDYTTPLKLRSSMTFYFVISPENRQLLYFEDESGNNLSGLTLTETGIDTEVLEKDSGIILYKDSLYSFLTDTVETQSFGALYLVGMEEMDYTAFFKMPLCCTVFFMMLAGILVYYVRQARTTAVNRKTFRIKEIVLVLAAALCIFLFDAYLVRLGFISKMNKQYTSMTAGIDATAAEQYAQFYKSYDELLNLYSETGDKLRTDIEAHEADIFTTEAEDTFIYRKYSNGSNVPYRDTLGNPVRSVIRSGYLQSLMQQYGLNSLSVYDSDGRKIASTDANWQDDLYADPNGDLYNLTQVLDRSCKCTCLLSGDEVVFGRYIDLFVYNDRGTTCYGKKDDAGITESFGMLVCTMDAPSYFVTADRLVENIVKDTENLLQCKIVMCSEKSGATEIYGRNTAFKNCSPEELGLGNADMVFSGSYLGFATVNGEKYTVKCIPVTIANTEYYFACYVSDTQLYWPFTAQYWYLPVALLSLLLLALAAVWADHVRREDDIPEVCEDGVPAHYGHKTFKQKNPEEKLLTLVKAAYLAVLLLLLVHILIEANNTGSGSVILHILRQKWALGINIFSFTALLLILCYVYALLTLLSALCGFLSDFLSARVNTLLKMVLSIIRYAGIIFCVFFFLYLAGMNIKTVLTSLGAFSILIGLAAQSLIKDLISGFFIMTEETYKIGDIVKIGNLEGKVMEIGLRSTQVEDLSGNITMISNSSISQVMNYSKTRSRVAVDISVDYGDGLDKIEAVYRKEREAMENKLGGKLLTPIAYAGIVNTDISRKLVTVRFNVECREPDRGEVKHFLYSEIVKGLKKYGAGDAGEGKRPL